MSFLRKHAAPAAALFCALFAFAAPYLIPANPDSAFFRGGVWGALLVAACLYPVWQALRRAEPRELLCGMGWALLFSLALSLGSELFIYNGLLRGMGSLLRAHCRAADGRARAGRSIRAAVQRKAPRNPGAALSPVGLCAGHSAGLASGLACVFSRHDQLRFPRAVSAAYRSRLFLAASAAAQRAEQRPDGAGRSFLLPHARPAAEHGFADARVLVRAGV